MARNIEIKAKIEDHAAFVTRAQQVAGEPVAIIEQDDCFFFCGKGRLKLRDFGDGHGELIAYERPDCPGPSASSYTRTETADPAGLRAALARSLGVLGRVRKSRTLYLTGRTRIHLDCVEGLGDYMELEVVLTDHESPEVGAHDAERLLTALGVGAAERCHGAYLDLLQAGQGEPDSAFE